MKVVFSNKKLEKLYETGSSSKYKVNQQIIESFFEAISILEAARDIHDLWKRPSLKFKKYKTWYSLRVTLKWRLEINIKWENQEKTIGQIQIKELSNHYGD
ncbi:MAG: type II toxin-antitoxin system RelE/ParE family toxin [Leptospirales bacterium]